MQIPVLVVLPWATAFESDLGVDSALPEGLVRDPDFPMIPVAGDGPQLTTALGPRDGGGGQVIVRGFVEGSPEDPPQMLGGNVLYADPAISTFLTCIGDPPVGTAEDVATQLEVQELWRLGHTGERVAIVILDTGLNTAHIAQVAGFEPNFDAANSWTPPGMSWVAGDAPVDHGTMCAFDALIAAPWATLVDYPILSANGPAGGSVMSGFLSTALLAFNSIYASWNSGLAFGDLSQYSGLVLSNSWGIFHPSWDFPAGHPGRFCDNPNHPFNLQLETMSRGAIDVLFAAGNCGADCPDGRCQGRTTEAIMGSSASVDAMSIAGCDVNRLRVGYSSQGPSITGMYGMKPDVTSYTHFLGSKAFGDAVPDSGTSAACPVAAGCMAALRTRVSPRSPADPYMMYSHLRQQATPAAGTAAGWNGDYGYGILNPLAVAHLFPPP